MKNAKFYLTSALMSCALCVNAQTVKSHQVEGGGTGPYKAEVVADASLTTHTIYRPKDMKAAVQAQGKLPVLLYANGACANNNVEMRLLLSEVASHGYIAIAIGPYDEDDPSAKWKDVLKGAYPEEKGEVVLANGERLEKPTAAEVEAINKARQEMIEAMKKAEETAKKKGAKKGEQPVAAFRTYSKQLLEAMDWITDQNANAQSEYYHMIDLDEVAAMGQSCGGAQVLGVSHDPRIKTCIMLNSGIGQMEMSGTSKAILASVHTPMFYLIGGKTDVAYLNAADDFKALNHVPVVMYNTLDGHSGTYYEKNGGSYAVAVTRWLDWQLKGQQAKCALFLDDDYASKLFPTWTFQRKGF